jgi:hypothetical protein
VPLGYRKSRRKVDAVIVSGFAPGFGGFWRARGSVGGRRRRAWHASRSSKSAAPWSQKAVWSLRRLENNKYLDEGKTRWRLLLHGSMLVAVLSSMAVAGHVGALNPKQPRKIADVPTGALSVASYQWLSLCVLVNGHEELRRYASGP